MKFELLNCRPVPAPLADELREIQRRCGVTYTSIDRSQAGVDFARARGCQLSSQAELYRAFLNGTGNPANPPGFSTHERRSDGVAYPWITRGLPLRAYMVGIDSTDPAGIIREARELGWLVTITYPSNPREGHHVNFRKKPRLVVFEVLERGDEGARVRRLTGRLSRLKLVHAKSGTYLNSPNREYNRHVEDAVSRFQADHQLAVDGKYGKHTAKQLAVAIRRQRRQS